MYTVRTHSAYECKFDLNLLRQNGMYVKSASVEMNVSFFPAEEERTRTKKRERRASGAEPGDNLVSHWHLNC